MERLQRYAPFIGRLLLAVPLLDFGIYKINNWGMMTTWLEFKGFPVPGLVNALAIVIELAGGLLLIAGYKIRWAASTIIGYLILVTFLIHNFWAADPAAMQPERENFGKGLMILGGLLFVFTFGAGKLSVDAQRRAT